MFKLIALFAAISCAAAQSLSFNPLVLGSSAAGPLHTINLAHTPRAALLQPAGRIAIARPQVAYAAPQVAYAAPQIALAAPKLAIPAGRAYIGQQALLRDEVPEPYTFAFQSTDEFGTALTRSEQADGSGSVTGSYSLAEADGRQRIVEYVADAAGFRATVKTNEPGTANANPADVLIQSSAPSRR